MKAIRVGHRVRLNKDIYRLDYRLGVPTGNELYATAGLEGSVVDVFHAGEDHTLHAKVQSEGRVFTFRLTSLDRLDERNGTNERD